MSEITSRLIVSLLDRVTAPARAVSASIKSVGDAARHLQAVTGISAFTANMNAALERSRSRLQAYRASLLEVVSTAAMLVGAFKAPTSTAANWESSLEDIRQKADLSADAARALGERVRALAPTFAQLSSKMLGGVDFMVGMGASPAQAMDLIPPIGKAATAYRAEIEDLAKAGWAALDNLKVPAAEFMLALDAMAKTGKEGAFELKDMAKEFPALTASAHRLGVSGVAGVADLAAALQIARKGAADGSTAANNMANFLQKITMKDTLKNFQKFGVDVPKELKKAAKNGISPIEHMLNVLGKLTNGGKDGEKVSAIFGDKQVLEFVTPMLENMELYREIRAKALAARGEVEKDFQARMKTAAAGFARYAAAVENLSISFGNALLPAVTAIVDKLDDLVRRFDAVTKANPELVRNIALAVGGLMAFRVAAFAAGFAATSLQIAALTASLGVARIAQAATFAAAVGLVPFRTAAIGLVGVMQILALRFRMGAAALAAGGGVMAFAAGTFATLARAAGSVVAIFARLVGTVAAFSGVGLLAAAAVGAIVAAFVWLANNIRGIGTFLGAFGTAFMAALGPAKGLIEPVVAAAGRLYDTVASWLGPIDASGQKWAEWGTAAGTAVAGWVNAASSLVSNTIDLIASLPARVTALASEMYAAGVSLITALWDGLKAQIDAMIAWFSSKISELSARASALAHSMSFGLVGSAPAAGGGGGGGGGAAAGSPGQGRALGGNVDAGRSYWVGEKGREIFTPGRSGSIAPNGAGGGPTVGSVTLNMPLTFNGRTDDPREVARTVRDTMRNEVREALRSVFADTGVRYA